MSTIIAEHRMTDYTCLVLTHSADTTSETSCKEQSSAIDVWPANVTKEAQTLQPRCVRRVNLILADACGDRRNLA